MNRALVLLVLAELVMLATGIALQDWRWREGYMCSESYTHAVAVHEWRKAQPK